jgi:colanic acid/amylovoran biosynthesis glycosyltransferase
MKVAYLVSRFPRTSETFILRELLAVAREPDMDVVLCSLFPTTDVVTHPAARPWVARLNRPRPAEALRDLLVWAARRPHRLLSTIAAVVRGYATKPGLLVRALATVSLASTHARMFERAGVTHVHAHYASYPALAAWVANQLAGVPYSFTAHAHDIYVDRSFLHRKIADARFVIAISDFNRQLLARESIGATTPIHVIHCGVELKRYEFRRRRPYEEQRVRAICVASLQEHKGHRVLLAAAAAGGTGLARIELHFVGDGELREALKAQAVRLGLGSRVHFHGGLTEEQVAAQLDRASVFVLPCLRTSNGRMDGIPVAIIEALACGLVVVSTRLSGIPELVEDGVTGFLAEPGDLRSLACALERALSPEAANLDPAKARAFVDEEYNLDVNARRLTATMRAAD